MNGRNLLNWKAALLPATALTAALAVGIGYFAGGSGDQPAASGGAGEFKFDTGPKYAPGSSPLARTEQQAVSSIEMFRKVNEGYSKATASPKEAPKTAKKQMTTAELREFMRQARHEINYDAAAMAAAQAQEAQQQAGSNRYIPGLRNTAQGGQGAAPASVHGAQAQAAARQEAAAASPSAGRKSAFTAGFSGYGLSRGGQGARQQRGLSEGSQSTSEGGAGFYAPGGDGNGGGRDLNAGAYGSHGGGQSSAQDSDSGKKGGGEELKHEPAPVAYIWPRSVDFGKMYNGETAARLIIIMNIGDAMLKLGAIENMDDNTPFYKESDHCTSASLAPKKSCTFKVRFSPRTANDHYTGFSVESNDSGGASYQSYIEVKGDSRYSGYNNWSGAAGSTNRLDFDMVPEGYSMSEVLRVYNTSGQTWHRLKLDSSKLPGSFRIASDGCTGQTLSPHGACELTVNFVPDAATNRNFCSGGYGQYHAIDMTTGAKLVHSRPKFPPLVIDKPVEASPNGELLVLADYDEYYNNRQLVLSAPISARSCAPFPVYGLERLQHYFYFK